MSETAPPEPSRPFLPPASFRGGRRAEEGRPRERRVAMVSVPVPHVEPALTEASLRALAQWAAALLTVMGAQVLAELGRFSRGAGPGAMITIKRTRDGFTAQVTGAIVGGGAEPLTADAIVAVALDMMETERI